jgi:uncharacterized protein YecE (DUF72 family)
MNNDNLRIGTCSWKYDSWRGLVYSDQKSLNYLQEYSQQYNTVEIDQWFWSLFGPEKVSLPSPFTVQEYLESVPPDFKFSIKLPNSLTLTHFYQKNKKEPLQENPHFLSPTLFQEFLRSIDPLRKNLGPLMFQFEYLNKQKMPAQQIFQEKFAQFIQRIDPNYQYAVEIRNPNYLNDNYFEFLQAHSLSHVFLQGYYMPPVTDIYKKFHDFLKKPVVIRLHGPDRSDIEKRSGGNWNRILDPRDQELNQIAGIIKELLDRKFEVYVNMNNHYEGSAPLSIKRLEKFLSDVGK